MKKNYSLAFVVPRIFEGIAGGVETLVGELSRRLAGAGHRVEIFTTCAKDHRTWANEFPEGPSQEFGVTVRRFPVDRRNLDVWIPRQIAISKGERLSLDDQILWLDHGVNSRAMYEAIVRAAPGFDALFFAPYLFSTTIYGSLLVPEKSYLIPCLHNESYAYVDVVKSMFKKTAGSMFNSAAEMELARSLYGNIKGAEVGMGFVPHAEAAVHELRPFFKDNKPYILYLGRKETGKNVQVLIDYFIQAKDAGLWQEDVQLVIAGGGSFDDLHRPRAKTRSDIIDIAHVSEEEKRRLVRHALVLCQPSTNESFSIVLMEAWLLDVPVLVHGECAVTKDAVRKSGGGLYFENAGDFAAIMSTLLADSELRATLAKSGGDFVKDYYAWDAVLARFTDFMTEMQGGSAAAAPATGNLA